MIKTHFAAIRSDVFAKYEKEFAERMTSTLSKGYAKGLLELPLVKVVEDVVNSVRDFNVTNRKPYFKLSTKSVFIHGSKSQVEFDCYGQRARRELGDLVFIVSVIFNGQKYFEKFTINQFKKDKKSSGRSISWSIANKEQLYLLSRFPVFRGVKGSLIPAKNYNLPNYSGALGSYGLLYRPGDFAFVSSTKLDSFLGKRQSLKLNELPMITAVAQTHTFFPPVHFYPDVDDLLFHLMLRPYGYMNRDVFGNCHIAYNVFEFVHNYLRMSVGEPAFMKSSMYNPQARKFLHNLLSAIRIKAQRDRSKNILDLIDRFFENDYVHEGGEGGFNESIEFDYEGGGIGIIHAIIGLGE